MTQEIINLVKDDQTLCEKYGTQETYKALKKQYKDVCSNGDGIINEIIDYLHSKKNIEDILNESQDKEFVLNLITNYLGYTIEIFMNNSLVPDPFWAD
jgi:hypothetical protein